MELRFNALLGDLSDEDVARAARERPREAFEVLFDRYRGPVYAHLARSGAPVDRLDDLFQTVFLKAFRSIRTFREEARFKTWLFTIATNVLTDEWRRAGRQGPSVSLEGVPLTDGGRSGRQAERSETAELVRRTVQALPEPSRSLLLLTRFQGMRIAEAAGAVGVAPQTAKVALFRAQRRLGAALARKFSITEDSHVPGI